MLSKTVENGSIPQRPASIRENTANNDSESQVIKECPFVRYGCLGCLMSQPAGHCICGNEIGDEYCQRDRKLNLRATNECIRRSCISAMYVENRTLVCTLNETKCHHIDRLDHSYGELIKTRPISEIVDSEKMNKVLAAAAAPKSFRHASGAIITEVPV